jgi:hypothetical protein
MYFPGLLAGATSGALVIRAGVLDEICLDFGDIMR